MQVILTIYLYFFLLQQPTVSVGPHCKMALSVPPSLEPAHSPPLPTLLWQSACPLGILSLGLSARPRQWTTATSCGLLALLPCGCSTAVLTMHLLQRILALSSFLLLQRVMQWLSVYIVSARILQKIYSEKRITSSRGTFTLNSMDIVKTLPKYPQCPYLTLANTE